jgi:photosystem II stability/assembly factor-like uncharacterized protein
MQELPVAPIPAFSTLSGKLPDEIVEVAVRRLKTWKYAVRLTAFAVLAWIAAAPLSAQTLKDTTLKGMKWRLVGPFRGGRAVAVAGVEGQPSTYYFGAVAGGVWKSTDSGATWIPIFDKQPVASIGAIAVAPSNPNVVYVGTGEADIRGDVSYGNGMYKSYDAGKTWQHIGLDDTRHIGAVIVDPHNPDIVLVAALGHAYGPNDQRGVFRSADGGKTWQKVLYKDDKTGAIDIVFDPNNSYIVYAALWQMNRTPYSLTSGGPGSGIYKSTDGGLTWKQLEGHGLPDSVLGRIGISVGADSNRVYALIEAKEGGLYRSDDAGATWNLVNGDHRFRQRAWYFTNVYADPKSPDTVYVLNTGMYRSADGGKSFAVIRAGHGDRHDLWIDPNDSLRMIEADDGGATVTSDGGKHWSTHDNQPTAQFYHIATDNQFLYRLYGAQQDSGTVSIASRSDNGAITPNDWYDVAGGESGFVLPDPRNPNIVYADSYDGEITRFDKKTGQAQDIWPWPLNPMGHGAANLKYRFQWTSPLAMSPQDPNAVFQGANVLFKTTDGGNTWTVISPDLTRNDKSKQQSSGGPITQDNTSVEYYDTIFAIAPSPVENGLIWIGSDDGLVHLTRDGGSHWSDVTPKALPEWSEISLIDPSPYSAGSAYIAVDRHASGDVRPYIYKTDDYGKTWTSIASGLPQDSYVHAVREDPVKKGLLFAGTELGIFASFDDGGNWQPLQLNLPHAPVYDLMVHGNDLIVATHGRAFWILDDISPLRQLTPAIEQKAVHLYTPAVAYRFRGGSFPVPQGLPYGQNPPGGAIIDYSLQTEPKDQATLEILDAHGTVIRKYTSKKKGAEKPGASAAAQHHGETMPAKAGLNRFVWDLRDKPASKVVGVAGWGGGPAGPLVVPGTYQAKLTVGGETYTAPIVIKEDSQVHVSQADLQKQFDLAMKIRDRVTALSDAVNQMRDLQGQLGALKKRIVGTPGEKTVGPAADDLGKKLTAIEDRMIQLKSTSGEDALNYPIRISAQLLALKEVVESADAAPTQASYAVFDMLNRQLDTQLAAWKQVQSEDLPALNQKIQQEKIPAISAPIEKKSEGK